MVIKNWLPLVLGPEREGGGGWRQITNEYIKEHGKKQRRAERTSVGHGQQEWYVVLVLEVLVSELLAIDALACIIGQRLHSAAQKKKGVLGLHLRFRCGW